MPESYAEVEARITEAIDSIPTDETVNLSTIAKDFEVPYQRLCRHFRGARKKRALAKEARNAAIATYVRKYFRTERTYVRTQAATATRQRQQTQGESAA